jgi:hypothetical protein
LAALNGQPGASAYDIIRDYWKTRSVQGLRSFWRRAVRDGVIAGTALPPKKVTLNRDSAA